MGWEPAPGSPRVTNFSKHKHPNVKVTTQGLEQTDRYTIEEILGQCEQRILGLMPDRDTQYQQLKRADQD
jgi:hypothetical protein